MCYNLDSETREIRHFKQITKTRRMAVLRVFCGVRSHSGLMTLILVIVFVVKPTTDELMKDIKNATDKDRYDD